MLIEISEVIAINLKQNNESFYWAFLPSKQVITLTESDELMKIVKKPVDFTQEYEIFNVKTQISRWILKKNKKNGPPMNDFLLCAKAIISERKRFFPLLEKQISEIKIPIEEAKLFPMKDDFFHFLFTTIYENWKYSENISQSVEEKIFYKHCEFWNFEYKFSDFLNWQDTEKIFYLKVVGEEFYLNLKKLSSLCLFEELHIVSDPYNEYDTKAMGVFKNNGEKIGFLRRTISDKLHSRMINEKAEARIIYIDCDADKNDRILIELKLSNV